MYNNIQLISNPQALKQGADLWFIPNCELNSWTNIIDWYLGFQIKKNNLIKTSSLQQQQPAYPTLIESSQYLPNLWTVAFPHTLDYLKTAYNIWYDLNKPRLRIFMPQNITENKIKKQWIKHNNTIEYVITNT